MSDSITLFEQNYLPTTVFLKIILFIIAMKIDVFIISGRTLDTEPCVAIKCEKEYYVFNCPEHTQRIFNINKWKPSKVKQFFFTDLNPSSIAGLSSFIITFCKGEKPSFGITAPKKFINIHCNQIPFYKIAPFIIPNISDGKYSDEFLTVIPYQLASSIAYYIKLCDEPGKFDLTKALQLGLKPGPLFKKLQLGESVTLDDGSTVIQPSMCIEEPVPGGKVLILNCLSLEDLNSFHSLTSFDENNKLKINLKEIDVIVHMTKTELLLNDEYQKLFKDLKQTKQICFHGSEKIAFEKTSELYTKITNQKLVSQSTMHKIPDFTEGESGMAYLITPSKSRKFIPGPKPKQDFQSDGAEIPKIQSFAISFLGTCCHYSTDIRNVAGILLHLPDGFIILDAGEGFLGQLRRKFGKVNADFIIKNLLFIFISHCHGDHYYGVHQILEVRQKLTPNRLPILADRLVINDLKTWNDFNATYYERPNIMNFSIPKIFECESIPVQHCEGSCGCVLNIYEKNGFQSWRISYSGDHRIQDDFVKKVGNCDLLIHEATFDDSMAEDAYKKNHSTISQALEIGEKLHAKYTILTHFSARYKSIISIDHPNSLAAFDYLTFTYEELPEICSLYSKTCSEFIDDDNDKSF